MAVIVIGVSEAGAKGMDQGSLDACTEATLICGGERQLGSFESGKANRFVIGSNLKELAAQIKAELAKLNGRPVVLASGDPLFFGIGRYLIKQLGAENVKVITHPSNMQLAFAKVGLNWDDAILISVHGRDIDLLGAARYASKIGVFTDPQNTPAVCADYLLRLGWPENAQAWVCENLEGENEKVTALSLLELKAAKFGALNTLIVAREPLADLAGAYAMGLSDELFAQRKPEKGLITKSEIRLQAIGLMRVFPGAKVWDIGAATGSIAIEAARLSQTGAVYAIEKNAEDCDNARENVARFHTPNVRVIHGSAPDALAQIPAQDDPDSVFVGGTSGKMAAILDAIKARLRPGGSMVVSAVTIENQAEALAWMQASGLETGGMQIQASRLKPILDLHRLDAQNPVLLLWGRKKI